MARLLDGSGQSGSALGDLIAAQFEHVDWEGFRFYDLIFPLLIFVTGLAIPLSLKRRAEGEGHGAAYRRVGRRALVLFALGVIYYDGIAYGWSEVRWLGVLQRIALCYLFASLLFLSLRTSGLVAVAIALLLGYWMAMALIPVPDIGAGSYAKEANLAHWIDRHYLPGYKWEGTWDPEGLLSTLPAIVTCLLGVFASQLLMTDAVPPSKKSRLLMVAGLALTAGGLAWGLWFPIIKSIWTSSFVLLTGGLGFLLLGLFHEIIDRRGWHRWAVPLRWLGANAIGLYLLDEFIDFEALAERLVGKEAEGPRAVLLHAVAVGMAVGVAAYLYRRKIFLRV
jgi:predicted acyltransferase